MAGLLVTAKGHARERWCPAFPDAPVVAHMDELAQVDLTGVNCLWLDLCATRGDARLALVRSAVQLGPPVVVMVAVPAESDAITVLQEGVQGYCHIKAAPEQLREIAVVVEHGGLWMPAEFMRRFFALSSRVLAPALAPQAAGPMLDVLTPRERMVAEQVARGASNREISASLKISERTVKSHLTVIFDKLGVRDRVQLALVMNNIPTCSAVD